MNASLLQEAVSRIVSVAHPLQVILFGSQARGTAREDSDYDFLVIGHFSLPKYQVCAQINRALRGLNMDRDIVLMSPEAFERTKGVSGTLAQPVFTEGRVVYDVGT
jgi:predicted nucleotidyltransferase